MKVILAAAWLGGVAWAASQSAPGEYLVRSEVRLVLLDASVADSQGRLVTGLGKDSFHVREDGKPQRITEFAATDVPATVGILVDESFSMRSKRADVLAAARTFIASSNPRDQVFVLNFNDTVKPGLTPPALFSGDPGVLLAALDRGVPLGRTALNDAILDGLTHLKLGRRATKDLVVISDGGDNASRSGRREVLDRLETSAATIYAIGLFDPEDPDRNPGFLNRLARVSGGEAYFPERLDVLDSVCRQVAHRIRSRYTIGYRPPPAADNSLHRIRVTVSAPGYGRLKVRTRSSYRYTSSD